MATIVNCDFCGRDTPNKSRICRVCMAGQRKHAKEKHDTPEDIEGLRQLFGYTDIGRDAVIAWEVEDALDDEMN